MTKLTKEEITAFKGMGLVCWHPEIKDYFKGFIADISDKGCTVDALDPDISPRLKTHFFCADNSIPKHAVRWDWLLGQLKCGILDASLIPNFKSGALQTACVFS